MVIPSIQRVADLRGKTVAVPGSAPQLFQRLFRQ
jgi:ABC-type nitrate/sulfonate/bicarbonate transport system substrate-binding protein